MAKHLLPASGMRHGKASRTGWDASPYRWTPFVDASHWRLCEAPIRVRATISEYFRRDRPPPAPSIAAQHLRASWRNSVAARPVLDLDVRTFGAGCFGAGVCPKNGSAKPSASRSLARVSKSNDKTRFANDQNKTPPVWNPRAFAFLGDRGDRSPGGGSVVCAEIFPVVQSRAAEPLRARCRIAPEARGFVWAGDAVGGFHG